MNAQQELFLTKKPSQSDLILAYLKTGQTLTPLEGLRLFNCLSVSQRIGNLIKAGHPIERSRVKTESNKWVASYSMKKI